MEPIRLPRVGRVSRERGRRLRLFVYSVADPPTKWEGRRWLVRRSQRRELPSPGGVQGIATRVAPQRCRPEWESNQTRRPSRILRKSRYFSLGFIEKLSDSSVPYPFPPLPAARHRSHAFAMGQHCASRVLPREAPYAACQSPFGPRKSRTAWKASSATSDGDATPSFDKCAMRPAHASPTILRS